MTREDKLQLVEELTEKFKNTSYFYVTDGSGLSVAKVNDFRSMCFDKGVEYKVVKNTLIKKALENLDADFTSFSDHTLKGFSGVMFSTEKGNLPAKILKEYRKKHGKDTKPHLKGASIDTAFYYGEESIETLSTIKSKEELLADVVALLQSPAKNVISALKSSGGIIAGLVKTLSEREE